MRSLLPLLLLARALYAQAALPTTLLNPTVPTVTGTSRTVCASMCDFTTVQAAWNASSGGDAIVITAGETFTGTLTLSNKAGTSYILIRSSASGSLTTGVRAGSADVANMPTLRVTSNTTPVIQNDYTNVTVSSRAAHHVYFLGLNITLGAAVTQNYGLVFLTTGSGGLPAGAPNNITFDRCWLHSEHLASSGAMEDFVRGFSGGGAYMSIINSTLEGFSSPTTGQDSQCALVYDGPGPGLFRNNYCDAATENMMFGGTTNSQTNQVADWEVSFSYFKKQVAWASAGTNAKNCFEFKTGVRMWLHDSLFDHCYANTSQTGAAILVTTRPSQSGYGNTVSDITIQGNIGRHLGQAAVISGQDEFCGTMASTVNTSGTSFTITGGTQGQSVWVQSIPLPVTVNGVANTITAFSDATHGTFSASAGTQSGVIVQTIYSQCGAQTRVTVQNNLFDDIDNTFNGGQAVAYAYLLREKSTIFDHNTMIPGAVTPVNKGIYSGAPVTACTTPIANYMLIAGITSNIMSTPQFGMYADCYASPQFFVLPQISGGTLTGNLVAGITGPEQTQWNLVGSANQFPANYSAIGLVSGNKSLSPASVYYSTGAGANVLCLDETAVTNGTVASTTCVASTPQTSSVLRGKPILRGVVLR